MILLTGSTGHFGRTVIDFLSGKMEAGNIAALARDEDKAKDLQSRGVDVRIGNYDNKDSLVAALKGIDKLLLISGSDIMVRENQHKNVIDAARETGVKHVIYTSFERKNEGENNPLGILARAHIDTDHYLKESGLTYTILRNNLYADGMPSFFGDKVMETGIYFPAGNGKGAFARRKDMAEAAAAVLAGEGHENKIYTISNTVNYSMQDMADILSEISGKKVGYTSPSKEEFNKTLKQAGVPDDAVKVSLMFGEAIKEGEFETDHSDIEMLTGHKPMSLQTLFRNIYKKD